MRKRFLANLLALTVCVGGFFAISFALNYLSRNKVEVVHELSFERRSADKLVDDRNWEGAARYYKQLLATDPYNGGAAFAYAECLSRRRTQFLRQIYQERRSTNTSDDAVDKAVAGANEVADEIIPAYEAALDFPRYRNASNFALARMHSLKGEKRKAIDYLLTALEDGYRPRYSISRYLEFQPILAEPEIKQLTNY